MHPDRQGVAVCDRCGDYHCADCHKRIAGHALCARCRELPGVDYLEDTRRRYWGKRDGFIWYFGALMPLTAAFALPNMLKTADIGQWMSFVVWLTFSFGYLAKQRVARTLSIPLSVLQFGVDLMRFSLGLNVIPTPTPMSRPASLALLVGGGLFGLALVVAAYRSPRNKMAFEIAVGDEELQRVYDRYVSNPMAVRGAVYSLLALFIPFASVITLVMSISAFRRAAPDGWPPRGGRRPALLGIAMSVLGTLVWGVVVLLPLLRG